MATATENLSKMQKGKGQKTVSGQVADAVGAAIKSANVIDIEIEGAHFPVGLTLVGEAKEAMSGLHGATQKWVKIQPQVSETFTAPLCYEAGTLNRKALILFLTEIHPLYKKMVAAEGKIEQARRAQDGEAEHAAKFEYGLTADSIKTNVNNAFRLLKKYYQTKGATTKVTRETPTIDTMVDGWIARCVKVAESDSTPSADKTRAVCIRRFLRLMVSRDSADWVMKFTAIFPLEEPKIAGKVTHPEKAPGQVKVTKPVQEGEGLGLAKTA